MNQDLRKEMLQYSNERILNNIRQQKYFSPNSVVIAEDIALQRKILDTAEIEKLKHQQAHKTVSNHLKDHSEISTIGAILIVFTIVKIILRVAAYN